MSSNAPPPTKNFILPPKPSRTALKIILSKSLTKGYRHACQPPRFQYSLLYLIALLSANSYNRSTVLPFALILVSMLLRKLRAKAGTDSMSIGLTSLIAIGIFFRVAMAVLPIGTVAMLPP